MKIAGMFVLAIGMSGMLMAGVARVPEIDAGSGVTALALLGGAVLIIRARRRK
jgi:hypothetical protein